MDSKRRSTHMAVSVGMLLAAIAFLLPIRLDGRPQANNAVAQAYTCWVNPPWRCCRPQGPGWDVCVENSSWTQPVMLDRDTSGRAFLDADNVRHLWFETPREFEHAFAVWYVVPITLVMAPSGQVTWARLGPLDSTSRELLAEVAGHARHQVGARTASGRCRREPHSGSP